MSKPNEKRVATIKGPEAAAILKAMKPEQVWEWRNVSSCGMPVVELWLEA